MTKKHQAELTKVAEKKERVFMAIFHGIKHSLIIPLLLLSLFIVNNACGDSAGLCGDNLEWELDNKGILTISGTGDMYNYDRDKNKSPWDTNYKVKKIVICDGVTSIGDNAFHLCRKLLSVTMPDTIERIGDRSFDTCARLKTINIPDSVIEIGSNPFIDCTELTKIIVTPDHPYLAFVNGVLFNKPDKRIISYLVSNTATNYEIPNGILSIGDYAFYFCDNIKSISIPSSLISIGNYGLSHTSMVEIDIPEGVKEIGEGAFFLNEKLTSVRFPESLICLGSNPFIYCYNLSKIEFVSNHPYLELINGVLFSKPDKRLIAFLNVNYSKSYTIPDGIEIIGDSAFYDCLVNNITIPESVKQIGASAFYRCSNLSALTIPESVIAIGENAFVHCDKTIFTVKDNSYAEQYFKENHLLYSLEDSSPMDWLNN